MEDNEIIIDTKLSLGELEKSIAQAEKDFDKLQKKLEEYGKRQQKYLDMGGKKSDKRYQSMAYDVDQLIGDSIEAEEHIANLKATRDELLKDEPQKPIIDMSNVPAEEKNVATLKDRLQALGDKLKSLAERFKHTKKESDKASDSISRTGKSAEKSGISFNTALKKVLMYGFGIRSLFKLVNKIRSGIKEGLNNFVQFDRGTNEAMSNITSSMDNLKNSLATAFAPLIELVAPAITFLIDKLADAISYINKFLSALMGKSVYAKATKNIKDYARTVKQSLGDLGNYDEINNVNDGQKTNPLNMFDTEEIESEFMEMVGELKRYLEPLIEAVQNLFSNLDFNPLINAVQRFGETISPIIAGIITSITWLINNALSPLANWTISDFLPKFFDMLSTAVDNARRMFEPFGDTLTRIWDNAIKPLAQYIGGFFLDTLDALADFTDKLADKFAEKSDAIANLQIFLEAIAGTISDVMQIAIRILGDVVRPLFDGVVEIVGDIISICSGICSFIEDVFAGEWEEAWEDIKDIFIGIWELMLDTLTTIYEAISAIVNDLFGLGWGGELVYTYTPSSRPLNPPQVPHLATGTVIPRSAQEFMAVLGDNNQETEVVSPLSTIKQAMVEALTETGLGAGATSVNVYLEGDAEGVFKVVRTEANKYFNRTGEPAFDM